MHVQAKLFAILSTTALVHTINRALYAEGQSADLQQQQAASCPCICAKLQTFAVESLVGLEKLLGKSEK